MILLIPLAIFLIACVIMIVNLAKTKPPTASNTVEALCDAIIRDDMTTQDLLCSSPIADDVKQDLRRLSSDHQEIGRSYQPEVITTWDDADCSYETIAVVYGLGDEKIYFTCRWVVNLWNIMKISRDAESVGGN